MPINPATLEVFTIAPPLSHHFKVLREAGVIAVRADGTRHITSLNRKALDARFPGLMKAVLGAGCTNAKGGMQKAKRESSILHSAFPLSRSRRSLLCAFSPRRYNSPAYGGLLMRFGVRQGLIILLGLLAAFPSRAEAHVDVEIGWGERARAGAWTPLFIKVSDPKARNAVLELHSPHDSSMAMKIFQPIAIGPSEQTYVIYAPLINSWGDPVSLQIRETPGGKILFDHALFDQINDEYSGGHQMLFRGNPGAFIGVSGRKKAMGQLDNGSNGAEVAFLKQGYLPDVAKGLDALDALFLNEPDFTTLGSAQQNAIADWVRAGGNLIVFPSEDPIPPESALLKLLPCDIGDIITITASPKDLQQAALARRFAKFKARALTPHRDALSIPLLGSSGAIAVRAKRGLGFITVVSFDTSDLMFENADAPRRFWRPILEVGGFALSNTSNGNTQQIQEPQRAAATGEIIDMLGNVPGVGSFGFKYVAMVLLGMMVIVGPIDWFVLKKMGRQQWTWVTTLGWISLITTGAIFIGSIFRSGDLHFRSMRVIDQADGAVVARTDVVGIYSPKTDDYLLDVPPGGWWEPISTDQYSYNNDMMRSTSFVQDGRTAANTPAEMTVNVWNLRFLGSETPERGEAVIASSITVDQKNGKGTDQTRLSGTITNLSDSTLQRLWLRLPMQQFETTTDLTKQVDWPAGGLAPKATLKIDTRVESGIDRAYWEANNVNSTNYVYGRYGRPVATQPADALGIVKAAGNLSTRRARRFNDQMTGGKMDYGVVYALSESAPPAVKLVDKQPIEKHWQVIRALVPLTRKQ
jgi:hypothetical protein